MAGTRVDSIIFPDNTEQTTAAGALAAQVIPVAQAGILLGQSVPDASPTQMLLSDVLIDNNALVDTANNRIVIQQAGIYEIYIQSMWSHSGGYVETSIYVNGTVRSYGTQVMNGSFNNVSTKHTANLNVGDIVTGILFQTSGSTQSTFNGGTVWSTFLSISKLPNAAAQQDTARSIVGSVRKSSGQSIPSAAFTKITSFDSPEFDPEVLWDATNSRWVIGEPGYYQINADILIDAVGSVGAALVLAVYKNGVAVDYLGYTRSPVTGTPVYAGGSVLLQCASSDYLEVFVYQDGGTSQAVQPDSLYNAFQIAKVNPDPSPVTQGALVAASAYLGADTAFAANATVVCDVEEFDTNNAYNPITGVFAAPVNGFYRVTTSGLATLGGATLYLWKNGTTNVGYFETIPTTGIQNGSQIVRLNLGDTLEVKGDSSVTLAGPTGGGKQTYIQFERIGA